VETRVEQRGADLFLIGAGDANLSGRVIPYQYNSKSGPSLVVMDDLAGQIAAHGISTVEGGIVGDDTAFQYEPYAHGWAVDDMIDDDGPPVGALVFNDNLIDLVVTPGAAGGAPASVAFDPPLDVFRFTSTAATGSPKSIQVDRLPNSAEVRVSGLLPAGHEPDRTPLSVDDPARYAALALKTALERRGIVVKGSASALHWLPGTVPPAVAQGPVIASRRSASLIEDLRVIDKVSQNLHADLLLFHVSKALSGPGSREDGLKQLGAFLSEMGIKPDQYCFWDGSGLSRMNLVTPEAVVTLLRHMSASRYRDQWLALLPVNGVDGSLAERLDSPRFRGRIVAKTGGLSHVSALSGYAHPRRGPDRIFSIFVNNYGRDSAEAHKLIDKICTLLLE